MRIIKWMLSGLLLMAVVAGCGKRNVNLSDIPEGLNVHFGIPTRNYKNMILYTRNQEPLNFGLMSKTSAELTINLTNKSNFILNFSNWRSPCPCIELLETPESIAPGQNAELILVVNPENYDGRIVRNIPLTCNYNDRTEILFLPVEFTNGGPENPIVASDDKLSIEYVEYVGGDINDAPYANAVAWILSGTDCAECNHLKMHFLPEVFKAGSKIVQVNLDNKEGLHFLLELEKRLEIKEPGDAPVMFFRGQLYYGNDNIKKVLRM